MKEITKVNTHILAAWQPFICLNNPSPDLLDSATRLLFGYFMSVRMEFREIAVHCGIIGCVKTPVTTSHFTKVIEYINSHCDLPICHNFCLSVEELSWFQIRETVPFYFSIYAELISLPHSNRKQFNKFRNWKPNIAVLCDALSQKIQTECLTTQELRLAYVKAVAGKKTLDPMAPPTDHLLTEGHIEPLEDFLYDYPAVAVFLYDNIKAVIDLGEHYQVFCRENAAHETSAFFQSPDHFHLLRKLTDDRWQTALKKANYAETHAELPNKCYPFATECLELIEELRRLPIRNANSNAWLELHYILHGTNIDTSAQQRALLILLEEQPNIAFFFYERRKKLITLAYHCRAQYGMHGKFGSNKSLMLFNKGIRKCHHEASSANNKQLNLSGA